MGRQSITNHPNLQETVMKKPDYRYEIMSYDAREISSQVIDQNELDAIDGKTHDCVIDIARGVFAFRDESGRWVSHETNWPGLGLVTMSILQNLQLDPGKFLSAKRIAYLSDLPALRRSGTLAARVRAPAQSSA